MSRVVDPGRGQQGDDVFKVRPMSSDSDAGELFVEIYRWFRVFPRGERRGEPI